MKKYIYVFGPVGMQQHFYMIRRSRYTFFPGVKLFSSERSSVGAIVTPSTALLHTTGVVEAFDDVDRMLSRRRC